MRRIAVILGLLGASSVHAQTTFQFPTQNYLGSVSFSFGAQNPNYQNKLHTGEDIASSPSRMPVYAAGDGTVMLARTWAPCPNWSYILVIEHRLLDGTMATSIYGHLNPTSVVVKEGQTVTKGTFVGRTDPDYCGGGDEHLHFGIHLGAYGSAIGVYPPWLNGYLPASSFPDGYTKPSDFISKNAGTPSQKSNVLLLWGQMTIPVSGLSEPDGIGADGNGNVFISDYNGGSPDSPTTSGIPAVVKVDSQGNQSAVTTSGVNSPYALAVDNGGNLYIADEEQNGIVKVTPQGSQSTLATVNEVPAVAVDTHGTVYGVGVVFNDSSVTGHELVQIDAQGKVTRTPWPNEGNTIFVDANGNIYTSPPAENGGYGVLKTAPDGTPTIIFPTARAGICGVDGNGNVYLEIGELDSTGVVRLDPQGNQAVVTSGLPGISGGCSVDGAGNLYLAYVDASGIGQALKIQPEPSVEVGIAPLGQTAQAVFTYRVSNGVTVGSITATGKDSNGEFSIPQGAACVPANGVCSFSVVFSPAAIGIRFGSVTLYDSSSTLIITTPVYGVGR